MKHLKYPTGFPSRFAPRLDKAILNFRHQYPLAGDAVKRIKDTIGVCFDIAYKAVKNGELEIGLAHSGLKNFALELCEDHTIYTRQEWWTKKDWDDYLDHLQWKVMGSMQWLGYLHKLDELSETQLVPSEKIPLNNRQQKPIDGEIRGERSPVVAARRAELRNMLRSGKTPTTLSVCKKWDSQDIPVPEEWSEKGITTWQEALKQQTHRGRVKKLVSKDSKFIRSRNL